MTQNKGLTFCIKSFGCQMNKLDTSLVASALKQAGFTQLDSVKNTDIVLINTCSVREHAETKVLSHIGHLQNIKEKHPRMIVGIFGCMAQRLGNELLENKTVDIVAGPSQIPQLPQLITEILKTRQQTIAVTDKIRTFDATLDARLEKFETVHDSDDKQIPNQAFVRVMRGCNNFCTYCIVPYVRGPEVSRPPHTIIEQIKRLAAEGVKLVTLLGQTVNSYEYKQGDKTYCLADLLEMASAIDGIGWIRFVTSYPAEKYFEPICRAMAGLPKVCNYLHIPAQSGSDNIL
ncbi:MAG: MiaB/RimO family radical SAM methylthiotransferase, partial [Phycisphaerae bacterium]|nr:MiaB/RimO family radical SAM methylthiotransferase [Phycisphaerae bacterium]